MSTTTASSAHAGPGGARRRLGRRAALLTALALVVSGAVGPTGAVAASAQPVLNPAWSDGCGSEPGQEPGSSVLHPLTSDGRDRTVQLHLPDGYDSDRAWPVVLVFHGRGNTGAGTEAFAGLDELPAIVAYGNGVIGTGDRDRQAWEGAPYAAAGVDDIAYTNDVLDTLESDLCVDTRRVYATGKSNGGGFTGILACELSDRIAAVAPVAAAFYGVGHPDCVPERPVPVITFHGTDDVTIPYDGDPERGLPVIEDWVGAWAERNGCAAGPDVEETAFDVTTSRWTDCARGAEVTHVAVLGGGHTWPGEDSYSGGGYATHSIEAGEMLWDALGDERLPMRFVRERAGQAYPGQYTGQGASS